MRLKRSTAQQVLMGTSSLLLLAIASAEYHLFHKYDWNSPFVKLFCFLTLGGLIVYLKSRKDGVAPSAQLYKAETLIFSAILCGLLFIYGKQYGPGVSDPPRVDIGTTTVASAKLLFNEHANPYSSQNINPRRELEPRFRGYHYGPLMLLAYSPCLVSETSGFKWASVFCLLCSAVFLALLIRKRGEGLLAWMSSIAFVLCLFFLSERFWYELFRQGANDIFPVALILASLLALKNEKFFWVGLLAGLSFSSKFSPAAFFIIPFLRKDLKVDFFLGIALGLVPLFAFLFWSPSGLIDNVFLLRFTLRFDSTSLYSVTPAVFHFVFPMILGLACVTALAINYRRAVALDNVLLSFVLLLIVGEVTFKEVHANHLIWFLPIFALMLGETRHRLFQGGSGIFKRPSGHLRTGLRTEPTTTATKR